MSIFTKILEKLGIKKDTSTSAPTQGTTSAGAPSAAKPPATATTGGTGAKPASGSTPPVRPPTPAAAKPTVAAPAATSTPAAPAPAAPKAISEVDVVKQLETKAKGTGLDWKVSIVDLLKLLDIDSSREARNELAQELGCPPEFMKDSAKMNVWLHKEVLKRIAQNGGNIPQNLLD